MSLQKIYKTKKIIKVLPGDSLSSALALLSSSHDAAFVMEEDVFLGVVNPHHCLIVKTYPGNAKVKHALLHPPRIEIGDSIAEVARHMIESKMHYLPIFEAKKFTGIITARRLISTAVDLGRTDMSISNVIKNKKPLLSIREGDTVAKALSIFKDQKVSKLVVLSNDLKLRGIISFYDLFPLVLVPKQRVETGARIGNKQAQLAQPVRNIMRTHVITLAKEKLLSQAARLILDQEIGSVIIVDSENHPVGIITTQDILLTLAEKQRRGKVEFLPRNIPPDMLPGVFAFVEHLNEYFAKFHDIKKVTFQLKGKKQGGIFEASVTAKGTGVKPMIIKHEDKNIQKVLRDIKKTIKSLASKK